jgi:hypothetical protein
MTRKERCERQSDEHVEESSTFNQSSKIFLHPIRISRLSSNLSYIHDVTFRSSCSSGLSSFG